MIDNTKKLGYVERVDRALKELAVTTDVAGLGVVQVQHDNWCPVLDGKEGCICTCDPDIVLVLPTGGFTIDFEGHPTRTAVLVVPA